MSDPSDLTVIPRADFLSRYWRYEPGEHVTVLGHTGSGKTWLMMQLLAMTASPKLPSVTTVMKPTDATVTKWAAANGHRIVRDYPVSQFGMIWRRKPNGYILWPEHSYNLDPDYDEARHATAFIQALRYAYKTGNHIVAVDDATRASELATQRTPGRRPITVGKWMRTIWSLGRDPGCGQWIASQRAVGLDLLAYNGASHLLLAKEPDARNRKRFEEIGGVDSALVAATTRRLRPYHFLYIRRTDDTMCIVGP